MFSFSRPDHRTAIVVDIGSSSVGVAIICSHTGSALENIWEHREYCLIYDEVNTTTHLRQIKTALTNAFLELTHTGLSALKQSGHRNTIDEVQAVYAAPWSYSIIKTISLKDEHPFDIDDKLIEELVESAKKQSKLVFATTNIASALGLDITHGDVINISINDYSVIDPANQKGRSIALSYLESAISQEVTRTLDDVVSKFFPKATITQYSSMYAFYLTMRNLRPNTSEVCLIDVTGEATEIGIVRDDILRHTTHIPHGTYTIARAIANASGVTKEEAYSYMKEDPSEIAERLPKRSQEKTQAAIDAYCEAVANLFMRTGDRLSIPRTIFLHTDARTERFFVEQLERAALKATGKTHTVHPVTAKVLGVPQKQDTALLLAINFFAKKQEFLRILPKDL